MFEALHRWRDSTGLATALRRVFARKAVVGCTLVMTSSAMGCSAPDMDIVGSTAPLRPATPNDPVDQPGHNLDLFLLIGQSNMEGIPLPEESDLVTDPRVWVLGYDEGCLGRTWNEWAVAMPPLHRCWAGVGPGDWFAKTLVSVWPDAHIGLIPAAISGAPIDLYIKGVMSHARHSFELPPDNTWASAYDMVVERAKVARRRGTIRAILFHQGEADLHTGDWPQRVASMVADLKADLNLPHDLPFLAGELVADGCCASQNPRIAELPTYIPNAHVVSSAGLTATDAYHFDVDGQRELGRRYAKAFLDAVGQ